MTDNHPLYGRMLAREIEKMDALPDFSEDSGVFILSDFGGEHKGANFTTYSFLICSGDKREVFEKEAISVREKHSLIDPWKEYGFKDLRYGPIKRALSDFLDIADRLIHGILFTVSIDKNLDTVFGPNKKVAHNEIVSFFKENDLGIWKGNEAEKLLRASVPISLFMSILATSGQKFLWLCDHDSINEDGNERDFSHTQKVLSHALAMYSDNLYEIYGFAKPFANDAGTSDLLSLTDFSAGAIQELLQSEMKGKDIQLSEEKGKILRWMGSESKFLKKINFVFTKRDDGDWDVGVVNLQAKI